jgi:crossover junction endodeoxyribonuclease RuvC
MTAPLLILGIDPGLRVTGFGVIAREGHSLRYVASGCVKSDPRQSLPERIATLFSGVREVIAAYTPDESAIEKVFVNVNPQSTLLLGQARGAALAALTAQGLPVTEYTALQIKQAVVGHGKAAKEQVQHMVARLLRLSAAPRTDAADALACAICHAHGALGIEMALKPGKNMTDLRNCELSPPRAAFRVRGGRLIG